MNLPSSLEQLEDRNLVEVQDFIRQLQPNVAAQILALRESGAMREEAKASDKEFDLITEADGLAERLIVQAIRARFPDDAIVGEEEGSQGQAESDWRWEIDPIDGTINFSLGDESGISVGLLYKGQPVMGVIHFLHDNTQMFGAQGHGAFIQDMATQEVRPLRIQTEEEELPLSRRHLTWDSGYGDTAAQLETFGQLKQHALYVTSHACFLTSTRRVLTGQRGAYVNGGPRSYDLAASMIIALEAGAVVEGLTSPELDFKQKEMPCIIARNQLVMEQLRVVLG